MPHNDMDKKNMNSLKKSTIDMQIHMAVKSLAIFQGEINCKIDELIKKLKVLQEKEELGEATEYLLRMIIENWKDLRELMDRRNELQVQIEMLEKIEDDLIHDEKLGFR